MGVSVSNTNGCHRFTGNLSPLADAQPYTTNADDRVYELTNHLGNVLATFTGRKLPLTEADVVVGFAPHVTSLSDYYPFGSSMKGRTVDGGYRYGFNGVERDDDVYGIGQIYSTEFRQYDSRLGRWKTIDPLSAVLPWESPYVFSSNMPVYGSDPSGAICLPCALLNGLAELAFQLGEQMLFEDQDFYGAMGKLNYFSVGTAFLQGLSPAALPGAVARIVSSPIAKRFITELLELTIEYAAEYFGTDEASLFSMIIGKFAELGMDGLLKNVDFNKFQTAGRSSEMNLTERALDRAKRINDGRASRDKAVLDYIGKLDKLNAEKEILTGEEFIKQGTSKLYEKAGREVEKSKEKREVNRYTSIEL